jgi:UDP-glucuronate 4-epimerase
MKVLITGVNGFIGGTYAEIVRQSGDIVIGLDFHDEEYAKRCSEYFQIDLGSAEASQEMLKVPAIDLILHAGAISGLMVETDNPRSIVAVNVGGTLSVLELARRAQCRRVVLCSTVMVYGPVEHDHDETEYPEPMSVYGASKVAVEALMHAFASHYGVDAIALRFTHVYGPGRRTECFVRDMLVAAAQGRPCHLPQASGSLRQYVHVADVCHAIELAMRVAAPRSRVFNISADEIHTLTEVADIVRQVTGKLEVTFDEQRNLSNYRIGKLSIRRAREELGYAPRFPLAEGIRQYWASSFGGSFTPT